MSWLKLHHVSVIVTDLERASAFYRSLFKLEPIERPPFTIPGQWLGVGSHAIHLTVHAEGHFRDKPVDPNDTHFAFHTDDFEGFVAHAATLGFREDSDPADPMFMLVRRTGLAGFPQAYLMDPDRNIIEVNGAR